MTRYLILGTGVAGLAAAESIRALDENAEITFVGEDPHTYYSRPGLAYYLSGEIAENLLYPYQPQDYQNLKVNFYNGIATKIDSTRQIVEIQNQGEFAYDRLLIATGASATRLNIPGADLKGVFKLDHMQDARQILAHAKHAKTAVVTGGGITALELAEGLAARRLKVQYVLRGDRYWPNVLDEIESQIIEKRLTNEGIVLQHNAELAEIIGTHGVVESVLLKDGRQIKCELVAYAIGILPRTELALQAGLNCERGILVNEFMQSSHANIYAAGDVAQAFDPMIGKHVLDSLWAPAREQGRIAGMNMAGHVEKYNKPAPINVTRLSGLTTTIIGTVGSGRDSDLVGIARGDSETWRQIPKAWIAQSGFENNHLRLVIGKKNIVGAIVMGDQKLSSPLQRIIQEQLDISSIRENLLKDNAPIADIVADFWAAEIESN